MGHASRKQGAHGAPGASTRAFSRAGSAEARIGGPEEGDGGDPERGSEMRHARVRAHEARQACQQARQQRGPVTAHEGARLLRRLPADFFGYACVARPAEEHGRQSRPGEPVGERGPAARGPALGGPGGRAEVEADERPTRARPLRLAEQRVHLCLGARVLDQTQPRLGERRRHAHRLDEQPILVHLMPARLGQRHAISEIEPARVGVEAGPPPRAPAAGRARGLEGVGQDDGQVRTGPREGPGEPPPRDAGRVVEDGVGQPLSAEHRAPSGPPP